MKIHCKDPAFALFLSFLFNWLDDKNELANSKLGIDIDVYCIKVGTPSSSLSYIKTSVYFTDC
jgi:hypothetical protein